MLLPIVNAKDSKDMEFISYIAKDITCGVEVEFNPMDNMESNSIWASFKDKFYDYVDSLSPDNRRGAYWVIKTDCSFCNGYGGEVNSPFWRWEDASSMSDSLKAVLGWLKDNECSTARGAGIHVNISYDYKNNDSEYALHWNWRTIRNVVRLFVKYEDVLYRLASSGWQSHRGKDDNYKYCKPLTRYTKLRDYIFENASMDDFSRCHADKYWGLNLETWWSRNTMEFRLFNDSLDYRRIMLYTKLSVYLVATAIFYTLKREDVILEKNALPIGFLKLEDEEVQNVALSNFFNEFALKQEEFNMLIAESRWQ